MVISYFKIVRLPNLLLLAITLFLEKIYFSCIKIEKYFEVHFAIFLGAILCITAGGYIINDIFDKVTDTINKPDKTIIGQQISEQTAQKLYWVLNMLGMVLIASLSIRYALVFAMVIALLYVYSSTFKKQFLIGNIIVAGLSALPIYMVGRYFELNQNMYLLYTFFAFGLSIIREIAKDVQDCIGDQTAGMHTLAIGWGLAKTKRLLILLFVGFSIIFGVLCYCYSVSYHWYWIVLIAVFIWCITVILFAKNNRDFGKISLVLKVLMAAGVLGICFLRQ